MRTLCNHNTSGTWYILYSTKSKSQILFLHLNSCLFLCESGIKKNFVSSFYTNSMLSDTFGSVQMKMWKEKWWEKLVEESFFFIKEECLSSYSLFYTCTYTVFLIRLSSVFHVCELNTDKLSLSTCLHSFVIISSLKCQLIQFPLCHS